MTEKAVELARLVKEQGGRAYYVGGFVRDRLLGIENKDVDVEIHGIEPDALAAILERMGRYRKAGTAFGIYMLDGVEMDIALPRTEHATGRGHRDFEVYVDPFIEPEKAARRRDFTVNAMMEDILTGEVLDFFGGRPDLQSGILRHVDDQSFGEDPLRVLRGAQFAARFGLSPAPETVELCRKMDLTALSRERVEGELKKALLKAERPSVFFEVLRRMEQLDYWFPEAKALIGVPQNPVHHPEGDVWNHTMEVLDRAALLLGRTDHPWQFMLLALTHDFGKPMTTENIDGTFHAYGHDTAGIAPAESFLHRLTGDRDTAAYVTNMLPLHMKPRMAAVEQAKQKTFNRIFDAAVSPEDLLLFSEADKPGQSPEMHAYLNRAFSAFRETMAKPFVMGRDLVEAGAAPGPEFTEALAYAHKLRLAGVEKENALRQTLAYIRKSKKAEKTEN